MKLSKWIRKLAGGHSPLRRRRMGRRREELFADLNVTRLETRRVLNGDGLASELVIDAGADANDGQTDAFHLHFDQHQVHVSVNGERINSVSIDQVDSIKINGSGDDDSLVVDLGDGSMAEQRLMPGQRIRFDGGAGQDSVRIVSAGHIESLIHAIRSPGVVDSEVRTDSGVSHLQFEGIEDLSHDASVDRMTVQLGNDADRAILDQSDEPGFSQLQVWQSLDPDIDSQSPLTISFDDPNEELRIVSDVDGETDADHIDVKGLADSFAASFVFQGDENDSIVFSGETDLGGGDLCVTAREVRLISSVYTDQATVEIVATEELTLTESGSIVNHGGSVQLSAPSIELNGSIDASAGFVALDGGENGVAIVRGLIDVSTEQAGRQGGVVHVLGINAGLLEQARIDASGAAGGGTVLIGGDYLGKGQVMNAYVTYVSPDAVIRADAIDNGRGGKVIVWADHTTRMHGTLSARGGSQGGDGGLIETSGKFSLDVAASSVNANATFGVAGTWLLDPLDVTISNGSTQDNIPNAGGLFTPDGNNAEIGDTIINTALDGGTNVTITTDSGDAGDDSDNGDVQLNANADIVLSTAQNVTFTIIAAGDIDLRGTITATMGTLNVVLNANDNSGTQTDQNTAAGDVFVEDVVTTNGGSFTSSGVDFDNIGGTITTDGGLVTITHSGDVFIEEAIDAGTGNVAITTTGGDIDGGGTVTAATLTMNASGGIGVGTTFNTDVDTLDLTTGGATAAGNITLIEADGASLLVATAATAQAVSVTATLGDLTIGGAVGDSSDNVTLSALAGNVDGGSTVTASALVVSAGGGIGIGTAFSANAATYSLTTLGTGTLGNITLVDTGALNTSQITTLSSLASAQTISLTATSGDLTINSAIGNTTDHLSLEATAGDVVGGSTATAATLTLNAGGGIGIGTAVTANATNYSLTTSGADAAGDITIRDTNTLNTNQITLTTDGATAQSISLTAVTGDLTVGTAIGNLTDDLTLTATAGNVVGGATATAATLTVSAGGGIGIGTTLATDSDTLDLTSGGAAGLGNITVVEADTVDLSVNTAATAQTVSVTITSGDLTVGGAIGDATDNLNLTALAGDIVGGVAVVTADTLTLAASGGIGIGTAVQANASSYSLTTAATNAAGNISLVDTGALNTNQITTLSTDASSQTISLTATTGNLTLGTDIGNSTDHVTLIATAGNIVGSAATTATAATLTLNAGGGIGIGSAVTADATSYSVTTAGTDAAGNITLIDVGALNTNQITTLATDASTQTIILTATTGDLTVGAGIGDAADNLSLIATAGNVVGGATVTADTLTVNAAGGIGIGTTLSTDVDTLDLTSAGAIAAGNITIVEADGANVSVVTAATAQTVSVTLTTGDLTVNGTVGDANDNVTLITSSGDVVGGATVTADTLTVNASGGIGIGTALGTDANTLDLTTGGVGADGDITVVQADAANLMIATDVSAQTISVTLSTGDFTVGGAIGDGNDSLTLIASGGDIVGGGTVTANDLTLSASGGIGIGTAVTANATTYSLTTSGANAAGNITLVDTGSLNTNQITTLATAGSTQTIDLTATTGDVTVGGAIGNATDQLNLTALAGDIVGGVAVVTADTLTLAASGGIGIGTAVQANASSYSLTTAGTNAAGNISLVDTGALNTNQITTLSTDASSQTISLTATTGNLTLGTDIGNSTDHVTLIATAGNIVGGAATTATAATLTLNAGGGIGIGSAVTADATSYSVTTAGTDAAGNITLIDVGALNTNQITTLATDASTQTIILTATTGDLTVGAGIGDAADNLSLIATAGNVVGGATVTADTLTVNAAGGIGIGTTLSTDVDTLDLTSAGAIAAGNITIVEADGAELSIATAATAQTVSVTLTSGDLTVSGTVGDANDNVTLITSAGDVIGGAMLTADTLTVNASGGIGIGTALDTDANTLDLTSGGIAAAGDITVVQADAANLMIATDASAQTISVTLTSGDFTVGGAIGDGNDSLTFIASAGDIVGGGTVTANDLTLSASGGIGIGTAVTANATTYSLTTSGANAAGNITLVDTGSLNTNQITTLATAGSTQTIDLTATTGDVTVGGAIGDATDQLNLTALAGDIVGGVAVVTADTLTLAASGGIGIGTAVQANASSYSLTTAGTNAAGNISLVDTGALNTNQITTLSTDASSQTISLTATTGNLTLGTDIGNSTDHVTLIATAGNIVGSAATTATAATLTLNAGGGIGIGSAVTADATSYSVTTAGTDAAGNITLIDVGALNTNQITTLATDASTQTIILTATTGDLTVGAGIGDAADNLSLIATAGNVVGGATVTADTLTVNAAGGIGIGTTLSTDVDTLDLTSAGAIAAGNITIVEADGANVSVVTAATAQTVSVTLTTGDLTVNGTVGDANDNVTLITSSGDVVGGATVTADTLTVNASGGIGIGTALGTDANTLDLTTGGVGADGDITVVQADAANLMIATDVSAQTISVTLSTGDFTVGGAIGDGNDSLTLIASGGDIVGGGTVTANDLTLSASGGIGIGTAVTANAATYSLTTNGANAAGNITLVDTGSLNTNQITALSTAASAQTIRLTATTGDLTVGGAIGNATDQLNLTALAGDIVGGVAVVTADTLTLAASGGIGIGTAVQANASSYSLTTAGTNAAGNISLVDTGALNTNQITTLSTDASSQTISLTATTGNLTLGTDIGNSTDHVTLIATAGNIVGGAATTATAATLTLNAGGGIGIGSAVTADATSYSVTTAGTDAAGNITLIDVGALNTNQITTLATDASTQTIILTATTGDLTVGAGIGDAADNLSLIATAGNVVGGATVTADTLTVNAAGGIGIGTALATDANTLNLTTSGVGGSGDITVVQADAANFSIATDASAQTISVTLSTGDITLGGAIGDANDSLTFNAAAGNIVGGGTVTANDLTLSASGGIGIGTAVTANAVSYSLTTSGVDAAGNITLVDTGPLNTNQITTLSTAASTQTISLTATTGDLTVGVATGNTSDQLTLIAAAGNIVGGATATAATLTASASGGIGVGTALNTNADTLNLSSGGAAAGGNITVIEADAANLSVTTAATAQTVSVSVTTGNLSVSGPIGDANDDVTLTTLNGNVIGGATVTADTLTVNASGGIGIGTALDTDADTLNLTTSGVGAAGNISVVQADAANFSIATDASAQTISVTLATGNFTAGGAIGDGNDSLTFIALGGNIVGGGTVTANDLTLIASGGIGIGTAVTADAATYSLTTTGTGAAGNIRLVDTNGLNTNQITALSTDASNQTISLTAATGDLTIGSAISSAADNLTLISTLANVVGGATVTAATLTLSAGGGIGIGTAVTADATGYSLTTTGIGASGDITLIDVNALNTNQITTLSTDGSVQTVSLTAAAGDLSVGATIGNSVDHLTLITSAGNVVGGATVTADTLIVNSSDGIGVGTALDTDANTLNLTTLGVGAAGDITVVQADASNLSIATDASAQTISVTLTTGDFTVGGAIGNGNDSLTFVATTGNIVGGGLVTANDLTLTAGGGIGIGTAVTANAATYQLTTAGTNAAGNITLIDANALSTSEVTVATHTSTQTIDLTASTGNLTIDGAIGNSTDHLALRAAAGEIVGGAVATADKLSLIAGGGIGLITSVSADAASYTLTTSGLAAAGNIRLIDMNGLNTSHVTLTTDVSAQTVELTASTGNLLIDNTIGNLIDSLTLSALIGDVVGGAVATANNLRLSAGGGIGIGTAVTADANTYHLTSSGTAAAGNVTLFDTNSLNTNQVTLTTDASAQTVRFDALAGDLTVGGAIGNATDSLALNTTAGNVVGGATVTAATLTVNASGGIGLGTVFNTDVDTLDLTSAGVGAAGNIRVIEADATTYLIATDASAQMINLTQSTGDITIGGAIGDGGDSLTFVATVGNIEGGGTVTANALVLEAGGGIGVGTAVTANASSYHLTTSGIDAAGNITLIDTNSLDTSQITGLSTATTSQTVSLTASSGNLTVDAAIGDPGDNLVLNAIVGNVVGDVVGGATATAVNLTVSAGGGIGIGAALNTSADTLNLTTSGNNGLGDITVVEADAVTLSIMTAGSAQTVSTTVTNGNLTISNPIGDANDNLTLVTSNGDVVGGGTVTADTLTVNSSRGIGNGIPLQTDANTLNLTSAGIGAAGNISVVQADAANLSIATDASSQMIAVTLTTGNFTVGGAIGDGNDSLMFAATNGNIIGGGTVTANDLTLSAGGGIGIGTAVTANAATYNLTTAGIGAAGNITLISANSLNTGQVTLATDVSTQSIDLTVSAGDLIVGGAIGNTTDNVTFNTNTGNVVGGATVSAATLTIISAGGIGIGTALNTNVDTLNVTTDGADAAGDITIIENNAVNLSIATAASSQTASVTVSNGNLSVGGPIGDANDDLILITSNGDVVGGGSVTADTLTINSSGGIGIGSILLTNANTLVLTSAGVDSAGDITVQDVGSADFMIGTDASSQMIDLTTRTGDFNIGGAIGDVNDNLRFNATLGDINGGGTLTANSLMLSAGGGIGIGTAVTANAATYSLTSAATGAAGNISLVDTGPLNTSQIATLSTHGSSQTVTLTSATGQLTVDSAIGNSTDNLTLVATSGDVIGGAVGTAGVLRLVAGGGIGVGTALTANATSYELSTSGVDAAGNISLVDTGGLNSSQLTMLSTDASTQTISLTASTSNLTLDVPVVVPNDNFTLIASIGAVQNTGASVTANVLSVDAVTGIGLNTNVTSLQAINRSTGDIQIDESGDITIANATQLAAGGVSISAGGTINVNAGRVTASAVSTVGGSITVQASGAASDLIVNSAVTSAGGQISLRADDDLVLGASAQVVTGSNDAVSVTVSANADGAGAGVLSLNDSASVATSKGRISGVLVNSTNPISGIQVGELLGGTQRNAEIEVQVNDPLGIGFVAEVDWLEGNPGDSDLLRRNPLQQNIDTGGVGVNFKHSYDVAPNQGDITVNVALKSIADGSIVLTQNTTDLLDRPEFTTTVTIRVEGALLPFSAPLPMADSVNFVRSFEQIVVTTPATQRIIFVTPPLQFNNSVGSAVVTSQRYYVLRIVSFGAESEGEVKLWDSEVGREEYSLPDLEDPDSGAGFELSQLPELFKRLPDDRYRIYLIEGQTERLVLDFIIRDGQPIEAQSDDQPGGQNDATESDAELDAEPPEVPAEASAERANLSSVERLGSVPVVSTGSVLLAAGMARRECKRQPVASSGPASSSQPGRERNIMSTRRPASWR